MVGTFVFWQGIHKPAGKATTAAFSPFPSNPASTATTTATTATDSAVTALSAAPSTAAPSTTTSAAPSVTRLAPREVKVLVANAADPTRPVAKIAGRRLVEAGYPTPHWAILSPVASSAVYAADDLRPEALEVARLFQLPDTAVAPLPANPPVAMRDARVLVVLGRDASL